MKIADSGHPRNLVTLGDDLDTKCGEPISSTQHVENACYRHHQHAGKEEPVPRLHKNGRGRVLEGAGALPRYPYEPGDNQYQKQRTDGDVPGHQSLTYPVLT